MPALVIRAGPRARQRLREQGLRPQDVQVVPAAAGGPKGLVLNPLDRFIFGHWLAGTRHTVHLLGASIGAWRMASAALANPDEALASMAQAYIAQRYQPRPTAAQVSEVFGAELQRFFEGRQAEVLQHPRYRLHVFTSRGRHLLRREGRLRTPLGYLGAWSANLASRRALGGWLQRVVFSDPREPLPFGTGDFATQHADLVAQNLVPAVLASCSIPFWLRAVHDIPGAPRGAYWDGGITDYHLHLDYAAMPTGLVLYPHFQPQLVPGWLDKALKQRHRSTARLDNVVLLHPSAEWVRSLPGGKLPDRGDFKAYADDLPGRMAAWTLAVAESQRLADELAQAVQRSTVEAEPL